MDKALLVIDYTYDFIADDGLLTCGKPGQEIEGAIVSLLEKFARENQYIVIANDIHTEDDAYHPEGKLFPPHNVAGSKGRELYGKVQGAAAGILNNIHPIAKTRYSAFAGTDLEIKLRERGIKEVHLVGVCTDICVLHTAIDAYNKGFEMVVYQDAVASFNQAGHEWALNHFKTTLGARVEKSQPLY
ncbi:MAG: cysteine hydrolase [Sporomusaceae bacterium]|jgi:nicotinamidase-related amidase|nr:cysteine hydrolase [Sporomusaceae bacterium]